MTLSRQNNERNDNMNAIAETQNRVAQTPTQDGRGFVVPPANIAATGAEYLVEVEMPGVNKEGLEVTVQGNELTIIGRRVADVPQGELCYCESTQADFRRTFELGPDVDTSKIAAEMKQGILKLRLPKNERAKPKQIEVRVS